MSVIRSWDVTLNITSDETLPSSEKYLVSVVASALPSVGWVRLFPLLWTQEYGQVWCTIVAVSCSHNPKTLVTQLADHMPRKHLGP